ncbi:hypothetical protein C8R45DRAFT_837281, partial [Mycena sanguinolenta]
TPDSGPEEHKAKITAHLTYHTIIPGKTTGNGAKSKSKPKEKKDTKTKEFSHSFGGSQENYIAFLKAILAKHGEEKYNITEKMTYSIKVQLPSVKKGDAVDIDTLDEYKGLVKDILEGSPSKIVVFVDMADIEKRWRKASYGMSDLDREMARLRGKLEKKYQNSHNAGYSYIDPGTGTSYPLTPQMMKEWCRAMYDGDATMNEAPSSVTGFDSANSQVALHPSRIAAGANRPVGVPAQGMSDLGYLSNILTTIIGRTGGQHGSADIVANVAALPRTPRKTEEPEKTISSESPTRPTPSKLPRFLEHATSKLGVPSALSFESPMRNNGFGPDILHMVEDQELTALGMKKGDVIRLKAGAQEWWNGPEAKKKRSHADMSASASGSGSGGLPDDLATPPSKKVSFERRYDGGGASRFYGPRIKPGTGAKNVFYRCPLRKEFVAIPLGYQSTQEEEYVSDDEDAKAAAMDLYNPPDILEARQRDDAAEVLASFNKS